MKSSVLKVAVSQMQSSDNVSKNINSIEKTLDDHSGLSIDLISFPENCLFFRTGKGQNLESFDLTEPCWEAFESWSKDNNCHLHFGSVAARPEAKRLNLAVHKDDQKPFSNATIWIQPGEKAAVVYEKIHLFDIQLKSGQHHAESELFRRGFEKKIINIKGWKIGLSICYDLRFANLFEQYAKEQVDIILVPSAFLVETGKAHWEVLLRARAIESQAYVIAAAQGGMHYGEGGTRSTYGHSLAIEPWGAIMWQAKTDPVTQIVELDQQNIESVRQQIPMASHRKPFD